MLAPYRESYYGPQFVSSDSKLEMLNERELRDEEMARKLFLDIRRRRQEKEKARQLPAGPSKVYDDDVWV